MENKFDNVKEKLANARKLCPGMSEEVYKLADFIVAVNSDVVLTPLGIVIPIATLNVLFEEGILNSETATKADSNELIKYLSEHKGQVVSQAPYVLQVIDAIAEKEFADEVRVLATTILKFNPPMRVNAVVSGYPEYIMVAVNWWANAIMSPKYDNGEEIPVLLAKLIATTPHNYSEDDILVFKSTLADEIVKELEKYTTCVLYADYGPCGALARAGDKIGMDGMSFPWKTSMHVSKEQVTVSAGYAAPWEILWSSKSKS